MERQTITSRQNPLVKFVCGLAEKKKRAESGLFRFDGVKLLREAVSSEIKLKYIICREPMSDTVRELSELAIKNALVEAQNVVLVDDGVFQKLSEERAPEGVICVSYKLDELHIAREELPADGERIIVAESLRDTGNLGTVIRSAYALGIDRIVLTDDCADLYNPKTVRAAMGAIFRMPTITVGAVELPSYIRKFRESGRRVYATALSENSLNIVELELNRGDCFVIGNEGHGLTSECISACDASVIIPMRESAESLNAAAAASICIWETVKA